MQDFEAIIDAFGTPSSFGAAVGIPSSHARAMKARRSIPPEYWATVVQAASERGLEGVTLEVLAQIAARKRSAETVP